MTPLNHHDYPPLRYQGRLDTGPLEIKTCQHCHGSSSSFGRSQLERQHAGTMLHLVDSGKMPPWPFKISNEEKKYLYEFARGMH